MGASEVLLRLMRSVVALALAVAGASGIVLILETARPEPVQVLAGRGPGVVTLLPADEVGSHPFTAPFAVDLALDPALLPVPSRSAMEAVSPHRRHSTADLLAAHSVAPALAAIDDPSRLRVAQIRVIVEESVGLRAVVGDLDDRDGDRFDDDGRFTLTALDGSAVCLTVGAPRHLARALGAAIDADGTPVSGVSWSPFGPCSAGRTPGAGSDVRVGTTPGTYGAKVGGDVCDVSALRRRLADDPGLVRVWAPPLGVEPEVVLDFVDGLTPVILLTDTAATDHELRGDRLAARQAVLERGSAVLVDPFGRPVVRCMSGSPLRMPQPLPDSVRVEGDAWSGFSLDAVRRVPAGVRNVSTFVLIDVDTGAALLKGAGIGGLLTRLAGPVVTPQTG